MPSMVGPLVTGVGPGTGRKGRASISCPSLSRYTNTRAACTRDSLQSCSPGGRLSVNTAARPAPRPRLALPRALHAPRRAEAGLLRARVFRRARGLRLVGQVGAAAEAVAPEDAVRAAAALGQGRGHRVEREPHDVELARDL